MKHQPLPLVEGINALTLDEFKQHYLPEDSPSLVYDDQRQTTPKTRLIISLESSSSISDEDLDACLEVLAATSADAYKRSEFGWHPSAKKKEMRLPDMRYLLVKAAESRPANVEGFASFMITYEAGHQVLYVYEIHLPPRLRGIGLGAHLMCVMEDMGRSIGVDKTMLTVFTENVAARSFYERRGYIVDDFSPREKRGRGGKVWRPRYEILSKQLNQTEEKTGKRLRNNESDKKNPRPKRTRLQSTT